MPYEITVETAKVYKVRYRKVEGERVRYGWADAAVRAWPGGGSLSIQSDYGNYAYTWGATGSGPFIGFLLDLDFDYFMGKARPSYMQFDHEKTMTSLKRQIIEHRRGHWGTLDKESARECWDDLELFGGDPMMSADHFMSEILRSEALSKWFDGDYDVIRKSPSPETRGFWEEIWPVLCAHWREEISPAANSAAA